MYQLLFAYFDLLIFPKCILFETAKNRITKSRIKENFLFQRETEKMPLLTFSLSSSSTKANKPTCCKTQSLKLIQKAV